MLLLTSITLFIAKEKVYAYYQNRLQVHRV